MRALNEDAENLMQDDGSPDPELNQLREEMKQCNEIYVQLSGQMQRGEHWYYLIEKDRKFSSYSMVAHW